MPGGKNVPFLLVQEPLETRPVPGLAAHSLEGIDGNEETPGDAFSCLAQPIGILFFRHQFIRCAGLDAVFPPQNMVVQGSLQHDGSREFGEGGHRKGDDRDRRRRFVRPQIGE